MSRRRIRGIVDALEERYGPRQWSPGREPLDGLVAAILSQNTTDRNSGPAFARLKGTFPDWDACMRAPAREIESAIRSAGLAPTKSRRIKGLLRRVHDERGELDLGFLADLGPAEALAWLSNLDGVGPKTAACVLMFCLGHPVLPVDTHVHRVSRRLGLIGPNVTPAAAHPALQRICPRELVYPFHVLMIAHGRETCRARNPACSECVLRRRCPSRRMFHAEAVAP